MLEKGDDISYSYLLNEYGYKVKYSATLKEAVKNGIFAIVYWCIDYYEAVKETNCARINEYLEELEKCSEYNNIDVISNKLSRWFKM